MRLEDPAGAELPLALVPAGGGAGDRRIRATFVLDPPPAGMPLGEQVLAAAVNVEACRWSRPAPIGSSSRSTAPTPRSAEFAVMVRGA